MSELTQNEVEDLILKSGSWESWANGYSESYKGIRVVERDLDEGDDRDSWYESPHEQGHEGNCYMVFEVDERYWRKTGVTDSYARRNWDGKFREVSKGEVIVTKYEWSEK